jgi:glutamyl/glutaminyl-tRNA synthetase
MAHVRFAPSPTGSLQVGNALTAVANRRFADEHGGTLLLRIDDTDPARNVPGGEQEILDDLAWLGVPFDEGPVRQSDRRDRYRDAVESLLQTEAAFEDRGAIRFAGERSATLLRPGGTPTFHLASVVDDADFKITHVIRGQDHRPNQPLHEAIARALGATPPTFIHHGLLLGSDGTKLGKRHAGGALAALRQEGIPPEALRRYLENLGLPRGNVYFDPRQLRRLATDVIAELSDAELAARLGIAPEHAQLAHGARDLDEAQRLVAAITEPPAAVPAPNGSRATLESFRELRERSETRLDEVDARRLLTDLRSTGANLRALRLVLTGAETGPELWRVLAALPRDEALRRIDAAL